MRRSRIEIKVTFFYILSVISLWAAQPEEALLQDWVAAIPERQGEAEPTFPVGDTEQAILSPPIRTTPRLIVWEVIPAISVRRIILTHGAPLAFGQIRPPALPVFGARTIFGQPLFFGVHSLFRFSCVSNPITAS